MSLIGLVGYGVAVAGVCACALKLLANVIDSSAKDDKKIGNCRLDDLSMSQTLLFL
jgi:hypothetical protein